MGTRMYGVTFGIDGIEAETPEEAVACVLRGILLGAYKTTWCAEDDEGFVWEVPMAPGPDGWDADDLRRRAGPRAG